MRLRVALVALAVVAAACGGVADATNETTPSASMAASPMTMEPNDMGSMSMGDPTATPAREIPGAELVAGEFILLASAPDRFEDLVGSAAMARHDAGTTVTIEFTNLIADAEFVAHVHAGTCFDAGGPHYKFDPAGAEVPPNEIHLMFASMADGAGTMTAENHQVAGPEATSVVVHEMTEDAPKIACADLAL